MAKLLHCILELLLYQFKGEKILKNYTGKLPVEHPSGLKPIQLRNHKRHQTSLMIGNLNFQKKVKV